MADPDNTFKNHLISIKKLKGKKRFEFIWEYYKIQIIMFIVCVIFAGSLINRYILNPPPKTYLNVSFYGLQDIAADTDGVEEALSVVITDEFKEKYAIVSECYDTTTDITMSQAMHQKFQANIMLHELDILICDKATAKGMVDEGVALPCSEYLTEEQIAKYSGKTFRSYATDDAGNDGDVDDYGFIVGSGDVWLNTAVYADDMVLLVVSNSNRVDRAVDAIEVILK